MTETTPDPADTHTGTYRVELTDAEFIPLCGTAGLRFWQSPEATRLREGIDRLMADRTAQLRKAYDTVNTENEESAARVQALTTEDRTEPLQDALNATVAQRDAARAELASATARCAELEDALPKRTNDWLAHCKRLDAERDAVSDDLCKAWKELGEVEAERDALQVRLDRLAYLWVGLEDGGEPDGSWVAEVRAALTPEGKPELGPPNTWAGVLGEIRGSREGKP